MWCVVHVKDRCERSAQELIAGLLPESLNARCFHLMRKRRKKYEGQWHTVQEELFPGYVFIDTDEPDKVYRELKKAPGPRLLFSDDEYVSVVKRQELEFMKSLADRNGIIGISAVNLGEDGTVTYLSGPLKGVKDRVKKVNLHKRVAELEASFLGRRQVLYLGIEIEGQRA